MSDHAFINEQNKMSDYWSIFRFKGKTDRGRVHPIRLKWNSQVARHFVLSHCYTSRVLGDKDFVGFNHFACHPVK